MSFELFCRYWNHQVKEVNYIMTRLWPWHKLPRFWELASRKWEQTHRGTEDELYLKQSRWHWSDHRRTNFKMTVRAACAVSACSRLPPPIEALAPRQGCVGLWTRVHPPPTPAAGIQNKANFPFHQPGLFIGFCTADSWTPLLVTSAVDTKEAKLWMCVCDVCVCVCVCACGGIFSFSKHRGKTGYII